MSLVPEIKQVQRQSVADEELILASTNIRYVPQKPFPSQHRYSGLKIAFVISVVWLCGFGAIVALLPVVPTKGHALIGIGMVGLVIVNFVAECFWGGGNPYKRSGTNGPGPFDGYRG